MAQIPERILLARQRLGPKMLYIGSAPLDEEEKHRLEIRGVTPRLIKSFTGAEVTFEDYYIYSLLDGSN